MSSHHISILSRRLLPLAPRGQSAQLSRSHLTARWHRTASDLLGAADAVAATAAGPSAPTGATALVPVTAAVPAPVTVMPLVDAAAMLRREAELVAASQDNVMLLGYMSIFASDFSMPVAMDCVKLSAWCAA